MTNEILRLQKKGMWIIENMLHAKSIKVTHTFTTQKKSSYKFCTIMF